MFPSKHRTAAHGVGGVVQQLRMRTRLGWGRRNRTKQEGWVEAEVKSLPARIRHRMVRGATSKGVTYVGWSKVGLVNHLRQKHNSVPVPAKMPPHCVKLLQNQGLTNHVCECVYWLVRTTFTRIRSRVYSNLYVYISWPLFPHQIHVLVVFIRQCFYRCKLIWQLIVLLVLVGVSRSPASCFNVSARSDPSSRDVLR